MQRLFSVLSGVIPCLFLVFALAVPLQPAAAQNPPPQTAAELEPIIDEGAKAIEAIKAQLENGAAEKVKIAETRTRLSAISESVNAIISPLNALRQTVIASLDALGPAPAEDAPPEVAEIAADRKQLGERLARIEGLIKRTEVINNQILLISARLAALSRTRFLDSVLDRGPWPLSPTVWRDAWISLKKAAVETQQAFTSWYGQKSAEGRGVSATAILGIGLGVVMLFTLVFRARVNRRIIAIATERYRNRTWVFGAALIRFFNGFAWVAASGAVFYAVAEFQGLISIETRNVALAIVQALFIIFVGREMAKAAFSPKRAFIRPLPLTNRQANSVYLAFTTALVLVGLDLVARRSSVALETGLNLAVAQSFIVSIVIAFVLIPMSRPGLWIPSKPKGLEAEGDSESTPDTQASANDITGPRPAIARAIAVFSLLFSFAIVIAAILGYAALARFAAEKVTYLTGGTLGFLLLRGFCQSLAHDWVSRTLEERAVGTPNPDGTVSSAGDGEEKSESFLGFWVALTIDSIVIALWLPFVLLVAGVDWPDIRATVLRLLTGIQIGPVTISFGDLLSAIIFFVAGIFLTRIIQKTLEHRILPKTSLNYGARSSITTLLGYVGILAASLIAVSVAGVDLSNLAIIAGALSVGIGFGLQSIVSNFVSGLILLFERPIKIGDWIVTSAGEGIVKRISVRATEIETFERQSIIVPNSEIITASVSNWSHRDRIARVTIPVGVSYNSDVRQVEKLLREAAVEHPRILSYPAPFIYFADYGDSALIFELRAFVRDNNYLLSVKNELRFSIWDKLKAAEVEIPFPQRDVHFRSGMPDFSRASVEEVSVPTPTPTAPTPRAESGAIANRDAATEAHEETVVVSAPPTSLADVRPPVADESDGIRSGGAQPTLIDQDDPKVANAGGGLLGRIGWGRVQTN